MFSLNFLTSVCLLFCVKSFRINPKWVTNIFSNRRTSLSSTIARSASETRNFVVNEVPLQDFIPILESSRKDLIVQLTQYPKSTSDVYPLSMNDDVGHIYNRIAGSLNKVTQ